MQVIPSLQHSEPLVLLSSARKSGETKALVVKVFDQGRFRLVDLLDYSVSPYSYSGEYPADDQFLEIISILLQHRIVIFATPNYWYSMSGLMKTFFDRFTDLITTNKSIGRALKGKSTFLIVSGADPELPEGFDVPFRLTSDYLGMKFRTTLYSSPDCPVSTLDLKIQSFLKTLSEE